MAGQATLSRLLTEAIARVPDGASPLEAIAAGLERFSSELGPLDRGLGPRLMAAVAASTELQERHALESIGLAAAMTGALIARGAPDSTGASPGRDGRRAQSVCHELDTYGLPILRVVRIEIDGVVQREIYDRRIVLAHLKDDVLRRRKFGAGRRDGAVRSSDRHGDDGAQRKRYGSKKKNAPLGDACENGATDLAHLDTV